MVSHCRSSIRVCQDVCLVPRVRVYINPWLIYVSTLGTARRVQAACETGRLFCCRCGVDWDWCGRGGGVMMWLPSLDSNQGYVCQRHACYHYTTRQWADG